ncbi:MAG TPA: ABC transporter ATP-binding protein [Longimicrobium sp.]|nr:ABC transporter ATP-binding protein [Longimicrobium sp.]
MSIAPLLWPAAELDQALSLLLRHAGLAADPGTLPSPPSMVDDDAVEHWLSAAAAPLDLEAEPLDASYADAAAMLGGCAPALVRVPGEDGAARFLALVRRARGGVRVLGPDRRARTVSIDHLHAALCAPLEHAARPDVERVLERAGVSARRRERAAAALLAERLGPRRVAGVWMLRPRAGTGLGALAADAGVRGLAPRLAGVHALQYALWAGAWALLAAGALSGRVDGGRLAGWALALMTAVPLRALSTWWQGVLGMRAGAALKRRLLDGALRLRPDEVRHHGAGRFLGTVIESEAMESLALSGGIAAGLGAVELALAFAVLAGGGWMHALSLASWLCVVAAMAARYGRLRARWTAARLEMTHGLVERMTGYRTRLAQQDPARLHRGEEEELERYLALSAAMDRAAARLPSLAARGWLLVGLAGVVPAFVRGGAVSDVAVALGGVLLAWQSLARLGPALLQLPDAAIAWTRVGPLFRAAARAEPTGAWEARGGGDGDRAVLEAAGLAFAHPGGARVLDGVSLSLRRGDRVLLEGPSGAGKSTLAAVLCGLREPAAGSLLLGGLDRWTVGAAEWRRRVAAAPQFHENHVLTGTLAFNLLMGRRWPAPPADLAEAEALCRELGLGPLLDRMPSGMMQMVGEGGWQLSHGERSRVFLARALLQDADAVVLDESFAALDPETLSVAWRVASARAPTLVVIAHP